MKSLILTHSMYQDQEVIVPYHRLREEGEVLIIAEKKGKIKGILGTEIEADTTTEVLHTDDALFSPKYFITFDLLVLPGGVKAMEKLRQDAFALRFVSQWFDASKPIASMCSGAQILISARVPLKGRRLSAYPAMVVDVENAGAVFVNEPVVVDGNIVSSPHYKYLAEWMKATIDLVNGKVESKVHQFVKYIANRINYADWFSIEGGHGWNVLNQLPYGFDFKLADQASSLGFLEASQTPGSGGYVRYRITRSGLDLVKSHHEPLPT